MNKLSSPFLLLLDIGNTRTKWGTSQAISLANTDRYLRNELNGTVSHADQSQFEQFVEKNIPIPDQIIFVCVASNAVKLHWLEHLKKRWPQVSLIEVSGKKLIPGLINGYDNSNQLGADRWVSLIGARYTFPGVAALVVNSGTATTIDAINAEGIHQGGWIIPGFSLMFNSLKSGTAQLPLSPPIEDFSTTFSFGKNTHLGIQNGVLNAQVGAILRATQLFPQAEKIILTGGNSPPLEASLKNNPGFPTTLYEPDLTLKGLYFYSIHSLTAK